MRGSGEKAQQLGASAALAENSGSVSSTNTGAHNHLYLNFWGV